MNGKIIVVGSGSSINNITGHDIYVLCLNTNGTPDTGFGTNGLVSLTLTDKQDYANDVAVAVDGKILITGTSNETPVFIRLNVDGTRDSSFGNNGVLAMSMETYRFLVRKDGRIMIVGTVNTSLD